jgi:hypothetical protein
MLSRAGSAFLSRPPLDFAALAAVRTPEVDVQILRPGEWRPAIGDQPAVDDASTNAPDR